MPLSRAAWLASLLALVACSASVQEAQEAQEGSSEVITGTVAGTPGASSPDGPVTAPPTSVALGTPGLGVSVHTTLGIPEAASANDPQHALLVKTQYVVSFDSTKQNPRWTSWELASRWIGASGRSSSWLVDHALPAGMKQASNADYTNSGFQRGHLCPSADRTDTSTDNRSTFLFTNAVPQTAASNTGPWEDVEREERSLADEGHHVFIIAGSLWDGPTRTIGDDVAVPSSMWKVIVVMDGASPKPGEVTPATRVISVEIPNTDDVNGDFRKYRTTMGDLETKTGFTFMADVARPVHDALATVVDAQ